jgi:hypothetical protein
MACVPSLGLSWARYRMGQIERLRAAIEATIRGETPSAPAVDGLLSPAIVFQEIASNAKPDSVHRPRAAPPARSRGGRAGVLSRHVPPDHASAPRRDETPVRGDSRQAGAALRPPLSVRAAVRARTFPLASRRPGHPWRTGDPRRLAQQRIALLDQVPDRLNSLLSGRLCRWCPPRFGPAVTGAAGNHGEWHKRADRRAGGPGLSRVRARGLRSAAVGLPDAESMRLGERGRVALGSCLVMGEDPAFACRSCALQWGREEHPIADEQELADLLGVRRGRHPRAGRRLAAGERAGRAGRRAVVRERGARTGRRRRRRPVVRPREPVDPLGRAAPGPARRPGAVHPG